MQDLEAQSLLEKTEPYSHNVGTCYRCGTTVDPRCQPSGLSIWNHWQTGHRNVQGRSHDICARIALVRFILIGWKISETGVFHVNYGGDTAFQPIIVMIVIILWWLRPYRTHVQSVAHIRCIRIPIRWTPGLALRFGRSQPLVGPMKHLT